MFVKRIKLKKYKDSRGFLLELLPTNYKKKLVHIDFWMASFGKGIRQYNPEQIKNLNLVSELYEKLRLASTKNDILEIIKTAKLQISKCLYSDEDLVANVVDYIKLNNNYL